MSRNAGCSREAVSFEEALTKGPAWGIGPANRPPSAMSRMDFCDVYCTQGQIGRVLQTPIIRFYLHAILKGPASTDIV